jgi:hypothetical protein
VTAICPRISRTVKRTIEFSPDTFTFVGAHVPFYGLENMPTQSVFWFLNFSS